MRNLAPALASITRSTPSTSPTNADSLVWDFAFSAIDGSFTLPANAFTVSGTTATVTDVSRYSIGLRVSVSGGDLASLIGDVTLGLANTDFFDDYGNAMDRTIPAGAELTYTVDNTAPTLAITPVGPVNAAFTATFTFSEAMSGFDASDVLVLNGAASNFAGSGAVYTATITPSAQGDVTVFVNLGSATDLAGNLMEGASRVVRFDSIAPTVSLSGPFGTVRTGFDAGIQFSESVTGLALGDITVGNGTASNLTGSGFLYNVTITPAGDGPVTVDLAAGVANDAAGNGNTAAAQFAVTMDGTAPTVTIGVPTGPVNGAVTVNFTFSENVTGFSSADIVATGANVSNFQVLSQSSYSARITPTASGTVNLSISAGSLTDFVGNPVALTMASFVADLDRPTLAVTGPAGPVNGPFTATFTFSESVTGFDIGDLFLTRGAASNFSGSGAVYTATITPNQDGQVEVYVANEVASDAAGNGNVSGVYRVTYDGIAPVVSISGPSGTVTGAFSVTFTFTKDVTGFALGDIAVGNGVASNFASVLASQYSATITPTAGGNVTVDIPAGAATDAAGNGNTAATRFTVFYNASRTVTVTRQGVGEGRITSTPADIDCGLACNAIFNAGTSVTLTAAAETGSSFASWTEGPCAGSTNAACVFTVNSNQSAAARFTLDVPPAGRIVASTLPAARSGHVGGPALTAFLSVVSRASTPAQSCAITAPAGAPVTLSYRRVDAGNTAIGPANPLFDIPNGGTLSFVIAMTPTAQTGAQGYEFSPVITCQNAGLDPIVGVNSVLLTIGAAPGPDLISISATPSNDGVIRIQTPGGARFMTASVINIGTGDGSAAGNQVTLTTTVDTGSAVLPLSLDVCQINAASVCITPRGPSVTSVMPAGAPLFFAVFARDTSGGAGIPFDPANARVFLRFADASGTVRSATSAAVTAPAAAALPIVSSPLPVGRWSVLRRDEDVLVRTTAHVLHDGAVLFSGADTLSAEASPLPSPGRFALGDAEGFWTNTGSIRLGEAWAERAGEFWGIRDARSDRRVSWSDAAGDYGTLRIGADGSISGTLEGCIVSGQSRTPEPAAPGLLEASVSLMSCARSGPYRAVIDLPANDNGRPRLVLARGRTGWALEASR